MNEQYATPDDLYDRDTCVSCLAVDVPCFEGRCQDCLEEALACQQIASARAAGSLTDGLFEILEDALGDLLSAGIELERERPHYAHEDVQTALARLALVLFGPRQCAA